MKKLIYVSLFAAALASDAWAGTTLTGLFLNSADSQGNYQNPGMQAWHTVNGGGYQKVWVVKDDINGPFINGPDSNSAAINIPLTSGTHTFWIFAEMSASSPA